MLSKRERLSRAEFTRFFGTGTRHHTDLLTLIYTPSPTLKAAAVVGKKVAKKAHERNTLRRRMYAAIERYRKEQGGFSGNCILIAKPPLFKENRHNQQLKVMELLGRVGKGR